MTYPLDVAIKSQLGQVRPAQDQWESGGVAERELLAICSLSGARRRALYLHNGLSTDALGGLAPVCGLDRGVGQALEGVGLEGPCDVAHGPHDAELPGLLSLGSGTDGGTGNDGRHGGCLWGFGLFCFVCDVCDLRCGAI